MTVTYTTVDNVAKLLGITISDSTTPDTTTVERYINWSEDYIDNATNHAWREKTVVNEYHSLNRYYLTGTGVPIYLTHRKIRSFDSDKGDKIEVWDGDSWVNYLTEKTEGRNKDYWVNYELGIIYLRLPASYSITDSVVRVTYRYGEDTVPKAIEEACTKLTAIKIIESDYNTVILPTGSEPNAVNYNELREKWIGDVNAILLNYREFQTVI